MAISKLILDGEVQMDVTQDTVTPNSLLSGYTATAASGDKITGNIETKSSSDISINGQLVTVPEGYYDTTQTKTVQSGSVGIPTITKNVSTQNHTASLTASVTASEGYVLDQTKTSSPVTVRASELVSGSKTIQENSTVDVTDYAEVVVDVPPNNQNKTVNPSTSQQIVTADTGYTGLGEVVVTAMPAGTAGTPTVVINSGDHSAQFTPQVTNATGYITGGTKTGSSVTVTAADLTSGRRTITQNGLVDVTNFEEALVNVEGGDVINNQNKTVSPTTSTQTVTADTGYTGLGTVTVNAMPTGTEGTPVADVETDATTQNIIVTPKTTNTAGYISGGLRVGEPVTINPGVTTFNGQTGDVTYTAPVSSVNGQTGAVTVTVPSKTSDLTNDSGFITSSSLPTKTSDLTNDSGFITASTAPVTSVNGKTGAVLLTIPATPAAYITEQGTKGGWNYRKWSNGTCECWATVNYSANVNGTWGSANYIEVSAKSLPFTFSDIPTVIVAPKYGDKTVFLGQASTTATKSTTPKYVFLRMTSATVSVYFDFYVIGKV